MYIVLYGGLDMGGIFI